MAGTLVITTLNNSTGVLATQNGMTGIAKAWVNFNGTGTVAIRDSFNVSSITDNGTGDYTVNFTTAMPNANYVVSGSANDTGGASSYTWIATGSGASANISRTTSAVRVQSIYATSLSIDCSTVNVAVFSS